MTPILYLLIFNFISSQQNFDGMTSVIKTYAQVSPERNKIKSWYKMPTKDFEAARTKKISQIQNGSSSPPQNYSGTKIYNIRI